MRPIVLSACVIVAIFSISLIFKILINQLKGKKLKKI